MLMREKITAIIPTLNEEENIEGAIESLSFADEIIVIDSYSTDKTLSICEKLNVRLIQRVFDDFSSQKNYAIDQASHNWIFILDADERIPPDLSKEIIEKTKDPEGCVAFNIYRTFYFKGHVIRYGGWQTDKVIRLFRKEHCRYDGKLVHEQISSQGEIGFLKNKIDHFSYRGLNQYTGKLDFYAHLQAKELIQAQKKIHFLHMWFKPGFRFLAHYMIRFGFLDGEEGYTLAKLHAKAVHQRYAEYDLIKNGRSVQTDRILN